MLSPSNQQVAEIFLRIGDLLDFQDQNTFRVRAYWRTAEVLRLLPEPLVAIASRRELIPLPAVGEVMEGKIREILETGTCELYEQLKTEVSADAQELLRATALPPRLLRNVLQHLGATTLPGFAAAVLSADLEAVPGLNQSDRAALLRAALALSASEPAPA